MKNLLPILLIFLTLSCKNEIQLDSKTLKVEIGDLPIGFKELKDPKTLIEYFKNTHNG